MQLGCVSCIALHKKLCEVVLNCTDGFHSGIGTVEMVRGTAMVAMGWMKKLKLTELAQHNLKSSWRSKRYIMVWRQYLMCRLVRAQTCSSRQDTTAASEATSASGISSHSPPLLSNLSMSVYWVAALCEFPSIWWSPSYVSCRRHQTVLPRFVLPAVHSKWFWDQGLNWLYPSTPYSTFDIKVYMA